MKSLPQERHGSVARKVTLYATAGLALVLALICVLLAMAQTVADVQRVSKIIGEITDATAQQSTGIGAVSVSVAELDPMTQQNAALVEESAAAADSLQDQASALSGAVAVFRLA